MLSTVPEALKQRFEYQPVFNSQLEHRTYDEAYEVKYLTNNDELTGYLAVFLKNELIVYKTADYGFFSKFLCPKGSNIQDVAFLPDKDNVFGLAVAINSDVDGLSENYLALVHLYRGDLVVLQKIEIPEETTCVKVLLTDIATANRKDTLSARMQTWPHVLAVGTKRCHCYLTFFSVEKRVPNEKSDTVITKSLTDALKPFVSGNNFNYRFDHPGHGSRNRSFEKETVSVTSIGFIDRYNTMIIGLSFGGIMTVSFGKSTAIVGHIYASSSPVVQISYLEPHDDPHNDVWFCVGHAKRNDAVRSGLQIALYSVSKPKTEPDEGELFVALKLSHLFTKGIRWLSMRTMVCHKKGRDSINESSMHSSSQSSSDLERSLLFLSYLSKENELMGNLFDLDAYYYKRLIEQVCPDKTLASQNPFLSFIWPCEGLTADFKDVMVDGESVFRLRSNISDADQLYYPSNFEIPRVHAATYSTIHYISVSSLKRQTMSKVVRSLKKHLKDPVEAAEWLQALGLPGNNEMHPLHMIFSCLIQYHYTNAILKNIKSGNLQDAAMLMKIRSWMWTEIELAKEGMDEAVGPLFHRQSKPLAPEGHRRFNYAVNVFQAGVDIFEELIPILSEKKDICTESLIRELKAKRTASYNLSQYALCIETFIYKEMLPLPHNSKSIWRKMNEQTLERREELRRERKSLNIDSLVSKMRVVEPTLGFGLREEDEYYPPVILNLLAPILVMTISNKSKKDLLIYYLIHYLSVEDFFHGIPVSKKHICERVEETYSNIFEIDVNEVENVFSQWAEDYGVSNSETVPMEISEMPTTNELDYLYDLPRALTETEERSLREKLKEEEFGFFRWQCYLIKNSRYNEVEVVEENIHSENVYVKKYFTALPGVLKLRGVNYGNNSIEYPVKWPANIMDAIKTFNKDTVPVEKPVLFKSRTPLRLRGRENFRQDPHKKFSENMDHPSVFDSTMKTPPPKVFSNDETPTSHNIPEEAWKKINDVLKTPTSRARTAALAHISMDATPEEVKQLKPPTSILKSAVKGRLPPSPARNRIRFDLPGDVSLDSTNRSIQQIYQDTMNSHEDDDATDEESVDHKKQEKPCEEKKVACEEQEESCEEQEVSCEIQEVPCEEKEEPCQSSSDDISSGQVDDCQEIMVYEDSSAPSHSPAKIADHESSKDNSVLIRSMEEQAEDDDLDEPIEDPFVTHNLINRSDVLHVEIPVLTLPVSRINEEVRAQPEVAQKVDQRTQLDTLTKSKVQAETVPVTVTKSADELLEDETKSDNAAATSSKVKALAEAEPTKDKKPEDQIVESKAQSADDLAPKVIERKSEKVAPTPTRSSSRLQEKRVEKATGASRRLFTNNDELRDLMEEQVKKSKMGYVRKRASSETIPINSFISRKPDLVDTILEEIDAPKKDRRRSRSMTRIMEKPTSKEELEIDTPKVLGRPPKPPRLSQDLQASAARRGRSTTKTKPAKADDLSPVNLKPLEEAQPSATKRSRSSTRTKVSKAAESVPLPKKQASEPPSPARKPSSRKLASTSPSVEKQKAPSSSRKRASSGKCRLSEAVQNKILETYVTGPTSKKFDPAETIPEEVQEPKVKRRSRSVTRTTEKASSSKELVIAPAAEVKETAKTRRSRSISRATEKASSQEELEIAPEAEKAKGAIKPRRSRSNSRATEKVSSSKEELVIAAPIEESEEEPVKKRRSRSVLKSAPEKQSSDNKEELVIETPGPKAKRVLKRSKAPEDSEVVPVSARKGRPSTKSKAAEAADVISSVGMTMEPTRNAPRLTELELKKQKLAELRANRQRQDEERREKIMAAANLPANGRVTASAAELQEILASVGVDPAPRLERTPEKANGTTQSTNVSPAGGNQIVSASRIQSLDFTNVQTVAIALKESTNYSKTTQTDDERVSVGEFSLGSQEFDYDDDMMHMDGGFRARTHSHDLESPMTEDLASILQFQFANKQREEADQTKENQEPTRPRDLSDEEKKQIMATLSFQKFFNYSVKIVERALAEDDGIFIDYEKDSSGEVVASSDRLVLSRQFYDKKWTSNREVTGIAFADQHPELLAVSYDQNMDSPTEPTGVVVIWNTKFKSQTPEYVFHCQSRLLSVTFARFHQNLIMAGCYSGQICMWDNRVANKKTPINKSPLNATAHTHPVCALTVIGSNNAHNLVSLGSDGRVCTWNVDNLTQPVDGKEIMNKQGKQFPVTCMSFPVAEMNNFVVGCEDGRVYAVSRHGGASSSAMEYMDFPGHFAVVTSVAFHRALGAIDFSHLFLTSSCDFTVKLWSTKDPQLKFSFEAHTDYVFDVAWSPVHPAVFTTVDAEGNLFLWNLNEDTEGPVSKIKVVEDDKVRRVQWAENGQQLCVGDSKGHVHIYDVHESMYVLRSEEWTRFARVLGDIKQSAEVDEGSEVMDRLSAGSSVSAVAALAGVNVSPRQAGRP
ncbi:unnamed protein product [Auanema sp. JU1783]|nr:unnamed protein product [Auanema sp. JU1783]